MMAHEPGGRWHINKEAAPEKREHENVKQHEDPTWVHNTCNKSGPGDRSGADMWADCY